MKVHLIKKKTIEEYCLQHARLKPSFEDWLEKVKQAAWEDPAAIKSTFKTADLLGNGTNRVIFGIGGNNCRMICKYAFGKKAVHLFICWIGTHAEYDRICKSNLQYTVNFY